MAGTNQDSGALQESGRLEPVRRGRIGLIVAGSLAAGLVAAAGSCRRPVHPGKRECPHRRGPAGFAFGWALLAVLSVRFSDQPQRWAAAPAVFLARGRSDLTQRVCRRAGCVRLGVAAGPVRARRLDVPSGPHDSCAAEAHGGCCTRYWRCWWLPRWAAATRPCASRSTRGPIPCPAS